MKKLFQIISPFVQNYLIIIRDRNRNLINAVWLQSLRVISATDNIIILFMQRENT